ncbi:MAG: phosphoglycerate dehydrogenase, partial [Elusimicrobia bacterium]|nr:phosphoglycerate dehydrogenase [Elusimicrobiota bacterium]
ENATRRGIVVANVPGGNTISAAEHTFAMILASARNVPQADASLRKGLWKRDRFMGSELLGKTLGIAGFGRIGKEVAKRALAFGMRVMAYDPFVSDTHMKSFGVEAADFESLLKNVDYLSLHLPATEQTRHIINPESLAKMKPDARLINCARGELVDETALIEALASKKIRGAALDVFSTEPLSNSAFYPLENVILTPHLGASTEEAQTKVAQDLALSIRDFFEKGLIRNAVNLPSLELEMLERFTPYLNLCEKLGQFVSQIVTKGVQKVRVEFSGDFPAPVRNLLTLSAIRGVLSSALEKAEVNWVNAVPLAQERGIRIEETVLAEAEDYTSLITVTVRTETLSKSVSGTVLSRGNLRIVRIDDLPVDVIPDGHLIVLTNQDKPGVVGFIGTILGENNINIAEFQVGRKTAGGEAVSILNIDSPVPVSVVKKISQFSGITRVSVVHLSATPSFTSFGANPSTSSSSH